MEMKTATPSDSLTAIDLLIRDQVIHKLIQDTRDLEYVGLDDKFVRDFAKHGGRWWKPPYHHGSAREWVTREVAFNERATLYLPG